MKDSSVQYLNLIKRILRNYELGDSYLILKGLELVGYENINFWFQLVHFVKKYKGIETLVTYVDVMQEIGKDNLLFFMNIIKDRSLSFEDSYEMFVKLLTKTNKYSEEVFKIKK